MVIKVSHCSEYGERRHVAREEMTTKVRVPGAHNHSMNNTKSIQELVIVVILYFYEFCYRGRIWGVLKFRRVTSTPDPDTFAEV